MGMELSGMYRRRREKKAGNLGVITQNIDKR